MPFSRGSSQHRDQTCISRIAGRFFTIWDTREAHICMYVICVCVYIYIYMDKSWCVCIIFKVRSFLLMVLFPLWSLRKSYLLRGKQKEGDLSSRKATKILLEPDYAILNQSSRAAASNKNVAIVESGEQGCRVTWGWWQWIIVEPICPTEFWFFSTVLSCWGRRQW